MSSRDMRLLLTSQAAVLDVSKPLAAGLGGPLSCWGWARLAISGAYAGPPSVGQSCQVLSAACLPVVPRAADPSLDGGPGAGCLAAGTAQPSELEN
jgi:hypothetical protein